MPGQIWWSRDEDGKAHPDDSILLAYIRQQSLDESWLDIHQHIVHCEKCQKRCNELRQTSNVLADTLQYLQWNSRSLLKEDAAWEWLQSPAEAQLAYQRRQHERLHEDLALGTVLLTRLPLAWLAQAVHALLPYVWKPKQEPQRRGSRVLNFAPIMSIPVVTFLVLALTAVLVLAELNVHYSLNLFHSSSSIMTTVAQSTVIVPAHPTSTLAVGSQSESGVTVTPGGPIPTIFECNDKKPHHFGICGKNFDPNIKVQLVVQLGDGSFRTRSSVLVDASGNFQDIWSVSSCKDAPITVYVQDLAHPSVNLGELQNIQYGKCSSNSLQRAGLNHH